MKLVFTDVVCVLLLLLLVAGGDGVLGEAALGNYYKEVVREQHEAINEMNQNFTELEKASEKLIDLGYHVAKHTVPPKTIKITNTVAVKVPVPFPVKVPEPVPVPVPVDKPVPIPVPTLVAVPVDTSSSPVSPGATDALPTVSYGGQAVKALADDADAVVAASSQRQAASGPAVPGQDVQEYVQSFPIHSVYDAGDDYNPMEGNRLALAAEHNTASPTESTFSNPGPSSLQQYQYQQHQQHHQHHQQQNHYHRQYHAAPKGSLSAATAERAKQGQSTAYHYRSGVRGSGSTGAAAAAAGQRQYHAGGEDQTAPAAVAHFGAAESAAIQSAGPAKPYGFHREPSAGGGNYKHHTPRTPDTPYTFASFYRTAHPSTAPSAPSAGEGLYRGRQSDGGEFARAGGAGGFGEGRGEAGDAGESYIGSFVRHQHHDYDNGGTTEVRFQGIQDQALQAQGEGEGESEGQRQGQGQGQGQEEEEEAARQGDRQTLGASVQTPRPFQTVRESYPHYEKPNIADYHHQYDDHHHYDHGSATSGLIGARGRGEFGGIGGAGVEGAGVGGVGGIAGGTGTTSSATGSILTEGYDHPSFGRPGGVSGGGVGTAGTSATTTTTSDTHRYPVSGGRSTHIRHALSTEGHHHTHPHHAELGQEAHPDLRHQTVHLDHNHDASAGALDGGGHQLERFPFYEATKDDPHFARRGQLKPYAPQSDASSGGPAGSARSQYGSGASKESTKGQQQQPQSHHHHHHYHHKAAASHYHTYTEHHHHPDGPGTQYTGAKFDEKYKAGGLGLDSGSISVPSDHHLYPNYGSHGAQYDHSDHAGTSGKFQFHYHNVHPYGTDHSNAGQQQQQSNGVGGSGEGAASSEHHYYHAEPKPTTFGQLTSYDPPASGGTTYHHFPESGSSDLLPGASEVHEQLAEDAVAPFGEPSPSLSSYTDGM